jgi:hypothetical protein
MIILCFRGLLLVTLLEARAALADTALLNTLAMVGWADADTDGELGVRSTYLSQVVTACRHFHRPHTYKGLVISIFLEANTCGIEAELLVMWDSTYIELKKRRFRKATVLLSP